MDKLYLAAVTIFGIGWNNVCMSMATHGVNGTRISQLII